MAYKRVAIFALFWFHQHVSAHLLINKSGMELLYNVNEYNSCLVDEFRLQVYVGRHLDDCITACVQRPHCKALTYHQHGSSSLCELFQTEGSARVIRTGCVYIHKKDMIIKKIPCTSECKYGTSCNMETQSCDHTGHKDCKDIYDGGNRHSDVYRIYPDGFGSAGIRVRCDMNTPPGGWTIIQRRIDARDFYKTWSDYKIGFGDLYGSYWLGNDLIWAITSHKPYQLRIDLTAQDGMTGYAEYDYFSIENETLQYALNVGGFHGNVGESLIQVHNGMNFSTMDRDNDVDSRRHCGLRFHGAWWYRACHSSNLNGDYMNNAYGMGLSWYSWRGHRDSMQNTEMKSYPAESDSTLY